MEGNPRHADHHAWGRVVLDRSAAGLAVGLRRGVVGPRAGVGDPRAGVARCGDDHDPGPVLSPTESVPQVLGGDSPDVRGQIHERVDQRPAGPLLRELADEAMGVDPVGGAEIDHAEHRLVRKQPSGVQSGGVGRLERGALRERVPRVVVCHAREIGAIGRRDASLPDSNARSPGCDGIVPHDRRPDPSASPEILAQRRGS